MAMTKTLSIADLKAIFAELSRVMAENRQRLIDMDAVVGDGDLGVTMTKGFAVAAQAAGAYADNDAGKMLMMAGMTVAREAPSTLGTLVASGFMRAGKELAGKEELTLSDSAHMLAGFARGIMDRGHAKPGDKTIVDALLPAVAALEAAPESSFGDAWQAALKASEEGAQNAKQMKAQFGRAAYQGENSIGIDDPGAAVGVLLVRTIAEAVR
jgi:dihydroxyacetone kinase-like protein